MEVKKIERLGELKDKIFAKGTFIVFDLNDPEQVEYNELQGEFVKDFGEFYR